MHVYVDDNPYAVSDLAGKTLRHVAQEIRQGLAPQGRMLVAIYTDSHLVPPAELDDVLDSPVSRYKKIDFQSALPQVLARES